MKLRRWLVAGKELRETLRDRRTLAVMVLFPLVVYPLVSLATAQVMAARVEPHRDRGRRGWRSRAARRSPASVRARLARAATTATRLRAVAAAAPRADDVRAGRVDAAGRASTARRRRGAAPAARVAVRRDAASARAGARPHRGGAGAGADPGCAPALRASASQGIAPRTAIGGYLLSKILPLVIVVMVMLGAFHPAIDITAGERERGTLETTLSAPIPRAALMAGKVRGGRDAGRALRRCSTSPRCRSPCSRARSWRRPARAVAALARRGRRGAAGRCRPPRSCSRRSWSRSARSRAASRRRRRC